MLYAIKGFFQVWVAIIAHDAEILHHFEDVDRHYSGLAAHKDHGERTAVNESGLELSHGLQGIIVCREQLPKGAVSLGKHGLQFFSMEDLLSMTKPEILLKSCDEFPHTVLPKKNRGR